VGDKLTTKNFGTGTCGFASSEDAELAVCVLPGTELAFTDKVVDWTEETLNHTMAIFRQVNTDKPMTHHDALEFPDGRVVLLTRLRSGQEATVLQLPAQPKTAAEADAQRRTEYAG
jgi:hypothetical protein